MDVRSCRWTPRSTGLAPAAEMGRWRSGSGYRLSRFPRRLYSPASPAVIIGHSKGLKQAFLWRGLITVDKRAKGDCNADDKAAKGQGSTRQAGRADMPKHAGMASGTAFCFEYLPSG